MKLRFRCFGGLGAVAALVFLACSAVGQISSEEPILRRAVPRAEEIESEETVAPYHLGRLCLSPSVEIRDASYFSNAWGSSANPIPDWGATFVAGTRLLLPVGGKSVFRAWVFPSYVYWEKMPAARGWGGDYGGEWIGLFNRLTLQAQGGYTDWITLLSSESEQTVQNHVLSGSASAEIDIFRRLAFVTRWEGLQTSYGDVTSSGGSSTSATTLNRTEQSFQAGIRYKPDERFLVGLLADLTRARFPSGEQDMNNDGKSIRLHVRYDRPAIYVEFSGGYATAEGQSGQSYFPSYRTGIYRWFVSYFPSGLFELQLYGWRRPVYSYFLDNPYFFETRNGLGAVVNVTPRMRLSGFAYAGTNQYPVGVYVYNDIVTRKDDVVSWGGSLSWNLRRSAAFSIRYSKDRYSSNVPGVQREVYRISLNLVIGGRIFR